MPLLFADDFPPAVGGIQQYMRSLADAFHRLGTSVTVVAPDNESARAYDAVLPYQVIRYRAGSRAGRVAQNIAFGLKAKNGPDYSLTSIWFPSGVAASLLPRSVRGSLGVLAHGTDIARPRGLGRIVMRTVLSRADAVFANSTFTRKLLEETGIVSNVHTSVCGVGDFERVGPRSPTPTILAVGRLIERKGFDRLIDAMPGILKEFPETVCEIVGDGPESVDLQQRARRLGVTNAITFLGAVDDAALRAAYGRAWCFALPVRRSDRDVEGFGIVYLEAAMAELPAIGGIDSGASDAILDGETGMLVDGRDVSQISAALLAIIGDRDAATAMGKRARERAQKSFSWESSAERIHAIMTRFT